MSDPAERVRCGWCGTDPLYCAYHDDEWGVPQRNSRMLWEMLMLEGFQAGLSWITILRKREGFRTAFAGFDPDKVAAFTDEDIERLMADPGIVRARAKIVATITGARIFCAMRDSGEDFSTYVWSFVDGVPLQGDGVTVPAQTPLSVAISKDLKKRGFKFVGPTIAYAWMQATGMVDDHAADCYRRGAPKP
jgi:DNA-3-methyladenine glycosylase I